SAACPENAVGVPRSWKPSRSRGCDPFWTNILPRRRAVVDCAAAGKSCGERRKEGYNFAQFRSGLLLFSAVCADILTNVHLLGAAAHSGNHLCGKGVCECVAK